MAAAFLSALGCDGAIARITLQADGSATASEGHTVVSSGAQGVELSSSRWPFVLGGDGKSTGSTRSIAPHTDFLEKLNRFTLVMPDCPWAKATITWGDQKVTVEGAQLKAGVNLMALFAKTPFDQASEALQRVVAAQQEVETVLVKQLICLPGRNVIDGDPVSKDLFQKIIDRQVELRNDKAKAVRAVLKPVTHHLSVSKAD
jgi:hypothetical protein